MSVKTTDADYLTLARDIYNDKYLQSKALFQTNKSVNNPTQDIKENHNWKTVTSIDDKETGLQGAMVVPADEYDDVVHHHKQPSQAIFVSRGTEPTSYKDWNADLQLGTGSTPETIEKNIKEQEKIIKETPLTQSSKIYNAEATKDNLEANQFIQYDKFVQENLQKYQPKEYSFTGHSLGGALATYEGVKHDTKAVAFAGANSYRYFNEQQKKDIRNGKYDDKITNYRHYGDIVPNVPFDNGKDSKQQVGEQIFVQSAVPNKSYKFLNLDPISLFEVGINELKQHSTKNWSKKTFNSDGSIKILPSKYASFNPENLNDFEKMLAIQYVNKGDSSEKIKISPEDVNILASLLINIVENEIATFVSQTNANAKTEFEDNYNFKKIASYIAPDLSQQEINDCLFDAGVTYQSMVEAPTESIKKKTKKMTEGGNELEEISDKTKNASSQFTNTDIQIGGQFS